jgi:hypothetical protein
MWESLLGAGDGADWEGTVAEKITAVRLGEYLDRRLAEALEFLQERNPGAHWDEERLIRHVMGYGLNQLIRQYVRKKTELTGALIKHPLEDAETRIVVEDVSQGGVGFTMLEDDYVKVNEVLEVQFALDDEHESVVSKKVVIRHVYGRRVGAEFCDPEDEECTQLGAYLLHRSQGAAHS